MSTAIRHCSLLPLVAIFTALAVGAAHAQVASVSPDISRHVADAESAARRAADDARAVREARDAQIAEAAQAAEAVRLAQEFALYARDDARRASTTLAEIRRIAPDAEDVLEAEAAVRSPRLTADCGAGDSREARFGNGVSASRRCAANYLRVERRAGLMAGDSDWTDVLIGSEVLSDFYRARGNRQQAIVDGGSAVTGVGALGAGLSSAAGPHTVLMWGYGALFGVMAVEFTGSQPTRDLYSAGHIGIDYIVNRYSVLYGSLQQVQQAERPGIDAACGTAGEDGSATRRLAQVEAWTGGEDKSAFLPVVRRLADTCRRMRQGSGELDAMVRRASTTSDQWPTALATDLLSLDNRIADRDARLRMTPSSALTAAAVGPLRLLDTLISGQNTQEALNRLRINTLLDDMNVLLSPVRVPAPPAMIDGVLETTPEFETRAAASGSDRPTAASGNQPTNAAIGDVATWVRDQLPLIETARKAHNDRVFYATELHEAARRSVLQFDYQVATGAAEVQLVAPAAEGATSTAAKDDGRQVMPMPAG